MSSFQNVFPAKLKPGDSVAIVAPSSSLSIISKEVREYAKRTLITAFGLNVKYMPNCLKVDVCATASVDDRLTDLHAAFADPTVKAILTVIGGFTCNHLLSRIDYDLIKKNPKILCGFSDITALSLAIFAQTGLVTYSGPHFSTFGMKEGNEYTLEWFKKVLMADPQESTTSPPLLLEPSATFSDDAWYLPDCKRTFHSNGKGFWYLRQPLKEAVFEGRMMCGNLSLFNLLKGTPYFPATKATCNQQERWALFLEDDDLYGDKADVILWQQLIALMQTGMCIGALILGRFCLASKMTKAHFTSIIDRFLQQYHDRLAVQGDAGEIWVIGNVDFGHTSPIMTLPFGGSVRISRESSEIDPEIHLIQY